MTVAGATMRRMSRLMASEHVRPIVSIGHLLSGNALSGGLMLVSTGIAARAMTTQMFGTFVLVFTFVQLVERIARFESWQPLIKFAAEREGEGPAQLERLYLYGLLLDVGAAILAAASALAIAVFCFPLLGFGDTYGGLVAICCVGTLFNITGVPTAALRLAGRFRTIAYSQLLGNALRIPMALYCWHAGMGIKGFLVAWMASQILGAILFLYLGFSALRERSVPNPLRSSPRHLARDFPGFLSFAWSTNLSMTMRTMTQEADTLLVGALAGASSAGFYHVAKRIAKLAQQAGAQAQAVLYPDMARLWARGDFARLRTLTLRVQFVLGAIGVPAVLVALLLGKPIVHLVLGESYGAVATLLVTQLVAVVFIMHAAPSRSVLLSMGKPQLVLRVSALGTALFLASACILIPQIGAMGASIAQILFAAFTAIWMDVAWLRGLRGSGTAARERAAPPN